MDVRVNRTNEVSQDVEVEIPADVVEEAVTSQLKQLSPRVNEPGFRKGKVPLKIIRRKYGQSARMDVIDKLVNEHAMKALQEEELEGTVHISRPELTDGVKSGPLAFTFTAENMPDVTVAGYIGLNVEQEKYEVSDEDIEEQLSSLQEEFTQLAPVEDRDTVEDGDVLTVDYQAKGSGPVEDIHQEGQEVDLNDDDLLEGFADGLIGATIDEQTVVTVTLPDEFSMDELAGEDVELEVTVRGIQCQDIPDIDDALAAQSGEADTLEELKASIRQRLEDERSDQTEQAARRRLIDQIVDAHEMTIPPLYVQEQAQQDVQQRLQMFSQQGMDPQELGIDPMELVQSAIPNIENSICEAVVLRGIADNEEITVGDDDIESAIDEMSVEQGIPRQRLSAQLQDPQQREQFRTQILFDRVLDFVWSEATVDLVDEVSEPETSEESEAEASDEANDDE